MVMAVSSGASPSGEWEEGDVPDELAGCLRISGSVGYASKQGGNGTPCQRLAGLEMDSPFEHEQKHVTGRGRAQLRVVKSGPPRKKTRSAPSRPTLHPKRKKQRAKPKLIILLAIGFLVAGFIARRMFLPRAIHYFTQRQSPPSGDVSSPRPAPAVPRPAVRDRDPATAATLPDDSSSNGPAVRSPGRTGEKSYR